MVLLRLVVIAALMLFSELLRIQFFIVLFEILILFVARTSEKPLMSFCTLAILT